MVQAPCSCMATSTENLDFSLRCTETQSTSGEEKVTIGGSAGFSIPIYSPSGSVKPKASMKID